MSLPARPEILETVICSDYKAFEKELHSKFSHRRGYGEWFDLTEAEVDAVKAAMREKGKAAR